VPVEDHDDLTALETETEEIREPTPAKVSEEPARAGEGLDELFPALDESPAAPAESKPAVPPPVPPAAAKGATPPPIPRPPSASSTAVEEALEEADFFVQQGLAQEAILYLEDLLSQYPGNRLIEDKLEELAQTPSGGTDESSPVFKPESLMAPEPEEVEAIESSSQITDEAFEALDAIESIINDDKAEDEMKVGATPTEIDPSDAQTHYDLGVAYMEMEVWESAIGEFRIASTSPEMEALCYNMIGNCLFKQGRIEDAIKEYKLGLFAKKQVLEQELNLYYDIAEAYLKIDDQREAIYYLQNIKKKDPDFKDVKLKLIALSSSYKPSSRSSSLPPDKKEEPAKTDAGSAQEVDDAFDDLFGDFGKDE
jgi:tetratricopeptide (TPR) repeat protein